MLGSLRITDLGVTLLQQNQQALVSYQKKNNFIKKFCSFFEITMVKIVQLYETCPSKM